MANELKIGDVVVLNHYRNAHKDQQVKMTVDVIPETRQDRVKCVYFVAGGSIANSEFSMAALTKID